VGAVLAAEWLKARAGRALPVTVAAVVGVVGAGALLAQVFTAAWDALPPERQAVSGMGSLVAVTAMFASLALGVFGTVTVTGELSSGSAVATFLAVPRRRAVLAAKAVVVGGTALVGGQVAVWSTHVVAAVIVGERAIRGQGTETAALVAAQGASIVVFALLGLALGALLRSAAAALGALFALWWVLPVAAVQLPEPWNARVGSVLPGSLPGQLAGTGNAQSVFGALLSPPAAAVVALAWVLVPLAVAAVVLDRRDV
jgi:hypothetical protein